ncbi:glycine zipper domain-containing protein [Thermopirellula anaerolimosa]
MPTKKVESGRHTAWWVLTCLLLTSGCTSTHADRGALLGGLLGAGTGAVVGNAVGSTAAGAALGAGVGAIAGAAIGDSLDEIEAQNRAAIAQQLGRELQPGRVTYDDVIAMTKAGVAEELILTHIRNNGMVYPPGVDEIIRLQQEGVSTAVIKAMQEPPRRPASSTPSTVVIREPAPPVVVHEYHDYWWGPPVYRRYHYHRPPPPGVSFGVTIRD